MPAPENAASAPRVAVHLLDSALGRPMRTWEFESRDVISIGRAEERDVAISDPYVSRIHAELRFADNRWVLISLGRYGVQVKGEQVSEFAIANETTFRLGASGPTLRFEPLAARHDNRMTMMFDSTLVENMFELDQNKLQREVQEIAEGDYFQELQKRAAQLRKQRT